MDIVNLKNLQDITSRYNQSKKDKIFQISIVNEMKYRNNVHYYWKVSLCKRLRKKFWKLMVLRKNRKIASKHNSPDWTIGHIKFLNLFLLSNKSQRWPPVNIWKLLLLFFFTMSLLTSVYCKIPGQLDKV